MICEGAIRRINWLLLMMMCRVSTFDFGGHQNSNGQIMMAKNLGFCRTASKQGRKDTAGESYSKLCAFHCWPLYMYIAGVHFDSDRKMHLHG
jgi:hypothetical protein